MITAIQDTVIEKTKKANWTNNKFHEFLKLSDQKEFLQSQVPFFYAVQAFPRMLSKLAMLIENSDERLLVVENIFEEHGQGKKEKYHTETYKTYLTAMGWDGILFKNPWIQSWIKNVLELEYSSIQYAVYLSSIEYIYALISYDVAEHIKTLNLKCEQQHYSNHAVLDWDHGYELLFVAMKENEIAKDKLSEEEILAIFDKGQQDFLNMYQSLIIPTKQEMSIINKEKIAFYYIREDSNIEKEVLSGLKNEQRNILSIASGGEHIFEYLTHSQPSFIEVIDINNNQIELSKNKLSVLISNEHEINNNSIFIEKNIGKFEKMFELLRSFFNKKEIHLLINSCKETQEKLKFIVDILFSNEYLNIVFGEDATKYTVKSFSEHFYHIFTKCLINKEVNTNNIFQNTPIRNYESLSIEIKNNIKNHTVEWKVHNPKNFVSEKTYDMMNISNIGDWMSLSDYINMVKNLKEYLNNGGCIIARKLLGDYMLKDIFENLDFVCVEKSDNTCFYSETIVAYKK